MVSSYVDVLLDTEHLNTFKSPRNGAASGKRSRRISVPTRFHKGGVCGPASTPWPRTTHNDGVHQFVIARTRSLDVNADVNIDADRSCLLGECALHRRRFGRRASMIT